MLELETPPVVVEVVVVARLVVPAPVAPVVALPPPVVVVRGTLVVLADTVLVFVELELPLPVVVVAVPELEPNVEEGEAVAEYAAQSEEPIFWALTSSVVLQLPRRQFMLSSWMAFMPEGEHWQA